MIPGIWGSAPKLRKGRFPRRTWAKHSCWGTDPHSFHTMGTRKTTRNAEKRARVLAAEGRSQREIAEILKAEGYRASKSTVARWLEQPTAVPQSAPDTAPSAPTDDDAADPLALLHRQV